jgi:hypothetical protein
MVKLCVAEFKKARMSTCDSPCSGWVEVTAPKMIKQMLWLKSTDLSSNCASTHHIYQILPPATIICFLTSKMALEGLDKLDCKNGKSALGLGFEK